MTNGSDTLPGQHLYGYVRVSTLHQEGGLDAQRRSLIEAGVDPSNIYEDRITGVESPIVV